MVPPRDRRLGWVVLWIALCSAGQAAATSGEGGNRVAEVGTFDNAAYDYWRALAHRRTAGTAEEVDIARFIDQSLPALPPKIFAHRPEIGQWLIGERLMLEALHQGGLKPACAFNPAEAGWIKPDLSYPPLLRDLMRRALAVAKAFEFIGKHDAVTSIYIDLFRMLDHIDADLNWVSGYYCVRQAPVIVRHIEGYLSRTPPRAAVEPLEKYLATMDRPRYPLRKFLRREMRNYAQWLVEDLDEVERKLAGMYGDQLITPAVDRLQDLSPGKKRAQLVAWLEGYEEEIRALAAAMEAPYRQGIELIREMDRRIDGIRRDPVHPNTNPLLPLLMPPMTETLEQFLAAEAAYGMVEIMAAAAVFRDFVGEWPETREELEQFSRRSLPRDPFTGEPFAYALRRGGPRIEAAVPDWMAREENSFVRGLDLGVRRRDDEARLGKTVEILLAERRQAEKQEKRAVPPADVPAPDASWRWGGGARKP